MRYPICRPSTWHDPPLPLYQQVMRLPDSELSGVPTCLYGGASGAVGLVASLPRDLFEMLAALQNGLKKVRRRGELHNDCVWRAETKGRGVVRDRGWGGRKGCIVEGWHTREGGGRGGR